MAVGLAGRANITPVYLLLGGSATQIIGFTLLSMAPATQSITKAQYGYGTGLRSWSIPRLSNTHDAIRGVKKRQMSVFRFEQHQEQTHTFSVVTVSATIQFRTMGGAIGLAIVTTATNTYIKRHLGGHLSSAQVSALLQTTEIFCCPISRNGRHCEDGLRTWI